MTNEKSKSKKTLFIISGIILIAIVAIASYFLGTQKSKTLNTSSPNKSETENPTTTKEPGKETEKITLEDAIKKIGMECTGPDFEASCTWNGISYKVSKPSDWSKDQQLRNKACDQGYINPAYLITSDNKSWAISTDYDKDTNKLTEELVKNGIDAKIIRYCY